MRDFNYAPIYMDEAVLGWLTRLRKENIASETYRLQKYVDEMFAPNKDSHLWVRATSPMGLELMWDRFQKMGCDMPDMITLLRKHTSFGVSSSLNGSSSNAYRSRAYINNDPSIIVNEGSYLKLCPKCEIYYHTWHQFPGVKMCAVHGVPLYKCRLIRNYNLKSADDEFINAKEMHVADQDASLRYARFVKDMYDDAPVFEKEQVIACLAKNISAGELRDRMLTSPYKNNFAGKRWPNGNSYLWNMEFSAVVCALVTVYGDYQSFRKKISDPLIEKVHFNYDLITASGNLLTLRCRKCGRLFTIHKNNLLLHYGCPNCEAMDPAERYRLQLMDLGYEPVDPFSGYKKKVTVRNTVKNMETEAFPYNMIWERNPTALDPRKSVADYQQKIDQVSTGFHVDQIIDEKQRVIRLTHELCRFSFDVRETTFLKHPKCRCCEMDNSKINIQKKINELSDEYTVVDCLNDSILVLWHATCGAISKQRKDRFMRGYRCPICTDFSNNRYLQIYDLVRDHAPGCSVVSASSAAEVTIRLPDGKQVTDTFKFFLQELMRPTPSNVFKERIGKPTMPETMKHKIYLRIKAASEAGVPWNFGNDIKADSRAIGAVNALKNRGYIYQAKAGYFLCDEKCTQ